MHRKSLRSAPNSTVHLRISAKPTCVRTAGLRPDDEDPEFMAEAVTAKIDPMSGVEVQRIVDALIQSPKSAVASLPRLSANRHCERCHNAIQIN